MKKSLAPVLVTLVLTIFCLSLSQSAVANPYHDIWISEGETSPDNQTAPPQITVSAQSGTLYGAGNITITVTAQTGHSATATGAYLKQIYYQTSWQPNQTVTLYDYSLVPPVKRGENTYFEPEKPTQYSQNISLSDVPDGNQSVTFYALERGMYQTGRGPPGSGLNVISYAYYYKSFEITGVMFWRLNVDNVTPTVAVSNLNNKVFNEGEVPLNFTTTEEASALAYSLDGQEKTSVNGNFTFRNLALGNHNITVYAWDKAGNLGASETAFFTVEDPSTFPTLAIVVVACLAVGFTSTASVIWYKRNKH